MTAKSVEEIKEKVDRLITVYTDSLEEVKELRSENEKLRNTINGMSTSSNTNSFEKEQIKKKVDALISEVDKCVKLMEK